MAEPIRYLEKTVGIINDERVFVTQRNENHIFFKYRGLGLSEGVIRQLQERGVKKVVFLFKYFKRDVVRMEVPVSIFDTDEVRFYNDRGDRQLIVPFSMMGQHSILEVTR